MLTVYISKLDLGTSTALYRFSLNTSTPSPWKLCSKQHEEVSSFQVWEQKKKVLMTFCNLQLKRLITNLVSSEQAYNQPHNNYTTRMTVCVSHVYHPYPSWMITSGSCETRHGWTPEFSFYVTSSPQQQNSRWKHKKEEKSKRSLDGLSLRLCSLFSGGCTLHNTAWDLIPAECVSIPPAVASVLGLMDPHREPFMLLYPVVSEEASQRQKESLT